MVSSRWRHPKKKIEAFSSKTTTARHTARMKYGFAISCRADQEEIRALHLSPSFGQFYLKCVFFFSPLFVFPSFIYWLSLLYEGYTIQCRLEIILTLPPARVAHTDIFLWENNRYTGMKNKSSGSWRVFLWSWQRQRKTGSHEREELNNSHVEKWKHFTKYTVCKEQRQL